jgi:hypothetical protein
MYIPEQFKQTEYKRIHAVSDASRKRMSEGGKAQRTAQGCWNRLMSRMLVAKKCRH